MPTSANSVWQKASRCRNLLTVVDAPEGQAVDVKVRVVDNTLVVVDCLPVTVATFDAVTVLLFVAIMSTKTPHVTVSG